VIAEREATATMTEVALAELDERGSQFSELDGAPFLEQVSRVDTDNATTVG
jgi:hypothetical protein